MDAVAISLALLQEAQTEPDLKNLARAYVSKGRQTLFERHRSGAGGLEIVSAWSTVMDHLIRHLYASISSECSSRIADTDRSFALVAQGGYGRGELNPHSDIDLLFLYPRRISPFVQAVTETLAAPDVGRRHRTWPCGAQPRRLHSFGRKRHEECARRCSTCAFCAATSRFFKSSKRRWNRVLSKTAFNALSAKSWKKTARATPNTAVRYICSSPK